MFSHRKPAHNILPQQGEVFYYPDFFNADDADRYFDYLKQEILWKQEPIKIFGKEVMQPRLTAYFGDTDKDYSYSGITMKTNNWTGVLLEIKQLAEQHANVKFNGLLLNYYRNGADSMGWHRDNEKELGINPVIASISFGASRTFQFRNFEDKKQVISLELQHNSLLIMQSETQHYWQHQLPKVKKNDGERINLTFRVIK